MIKDIVNKNKILKLLLFILICSNIYFIFGYTQRGKNIDNYHKSAIALYQNHIAESYEVMRCVVNTDDINSKIVFLKELEQELDSANSAIRICTPYYNSKLRGNKIYIGNGYASMFFESYKDVVDAWFNAYKSSDIENIPSDTELMNLLTDLKMITNVFQVYTNVDYYGKAHIDEIGIEELNNMFIDLAKNTQTDSVYEELKKKTLFQEYLDE